MYKLICKFPGNIFQMCWKVTDDLQELIYLFFLPVP